MTVLKRLNWSCDRPEVARFELFALFMFLTLYFLNIINIRSSNEL